MGRLAAPGAFTMAGSNRKLSPAAGRLPAWRLWRSDGIPDRCGSRRYSLSCALAPDQCRRLLAHKSQGPDYGHKNSNPNTPATHQPGVHEDAFAAPRVTGLTDTNKGTEQER